MSVIVSEEFTIRIDGNETNEIAAAYIPAFLFPFGNLNGELEAVDLFDITTEN